MIGKEHMSMQWWLAYAPMKWTFCIGLYCSFFFNPYHAILLQVYEDDLERNYYIIQELLIALREVLPGGIPHVKDFEAPCLHIFAGTSACFCPGPLAHISIIWPPFSRSGPTGVAFVLGDD